MSERAGEAVENAGEPDRPPVLLYERKAVVPSIAAMNDDGELSGVGELHLRAENGGLHVARGVVVKIIQANFAPGDDFGMLREASEFVQMLRRDFFGFVRVNTNARVNPIVLFGERDSGVEFFWPRPGANSEQSTNAGVAGALEHGFAIVSELRKIDVHVGVDEVHEYEKAEFPAPQGARSIVTLLQSRAHFHVFGEARQNRAAFRADGGGDDHTVRFDAAEFARREIGDDGNFSADERIRFVHNLASVPVGLIFITARPPVAEGRKPESHRSGEQTE